MRWQTQEDGSYRATRDGRTFVTRFQQYGGHRLGGEWRYGEIVDGCLIVWGETPLLLSARHDVVRRLEREAERGT